MLFLEGNLPCAMFLEENHGNGNLLKSSRVFLEENHEWGAMFLEGNHGKGSSLKASAVFGSKPQEECGVFGRKPWEGELAESSSVFGRKPREGEIAEIKRCAGAVGTCGRVNMSAVTKKFHFRWNHFP